MFFLFRYLRSSDSKLWVKVLIALAIVGLIVLRVVASRSHGALAGTVVIAVFVILIGGRLLMARRGIGGPGPGGRGMGGRGMGGGMGGRSMGGGPMGRGRYSTPPPEDLPFDSGPHQQQDPP